MYLRAIITSYWPENTRQIWQLRATVLESPCSPGQSTWLLQLIFATRIRCRPDYDKTFLLFLSFAHHKFQCFFGARDLKSFPSITVLAAKWDVATMVNGIVSHGTQRVAGGGRVEWGTATKDMWHHLMISRLMLSASCARDWKQNHCWLTPVHCSAWPNLETFSTGVPGVNCTLRGADWILCWITHQTTGWHSAWCHSPPLFLYAPVKTFVSTQTEQTNRFGNQCIRKRTEMSQPPPNVRSVKCTRSERLLGFFFQLKWSPELFGFQWNYLYHQVPVARI